MVEDNLIAQVFLPASLAFIMFTVGLELTIDDFKRVITRPKAFVVGAISQLLVLPLVAFALVHMVDMSPALAVGVMIIAACPGGVTSNLMTYLARADTALSVSLTAAISLLSVVTVPLIVGVSIELLTDGSSMPDLTLGTNVLGIFAITTVPVALGILVNRQAPAFAGRFDRFGRKIATILFVVIIIGAIVSERENIGTYFAQAGPAMLLLNVMMLIFAGFIARGAGLAPSQRTAITLECGLQNGTLAIFVALTLLGSREMMIPGAIYSLIMFPTAIAYLSFVSRRKTI